MYTFFLTIRTTVPKSKIIVFEIDKGQYTLKKGISQFILNTH